MGGGPGRRQHTSPDVCPLHNVDAHSPPPAHPRLRECSAVMQAAAGFPPGHSGVPPRRLIDVDMEVPLLRSIYQQDIQKLSKNFKDAAQRLQQLTRLMETWAVQDVAWWVGVCAVHVLRRCACPALNVSSFDIVLCCGHKP